VTDPKLGDPASSPRQPHHGDAKRARPIFERSGFGPWSARVTVTPIEQLRGRARAAFEVAAEWGPGDDRERPDVPGLTGLPSRLALDAAYVDAPQAAVRLAQAACERLRKPEVPDLPGLARALGIALTRA
jgi:hypothetical protein